MPIELEVLDVRRQAQRRHLAHPQRERAQTRQPRELEVPLAPQELEGAQLELVELEVLRGGLDAFKRIGEVVCEAVERRPALRRGRRRARGRRRC